MEKDVDSSETKQPDGCTPSGHNELRNHATILRIELGAFLPPPIPLTVVN